jgi:DNA-directed RNA polymerase subunit RPC12/RpoP
MNKFKFCCPQCDQHLECDVQFSGREIQCPSCNHLITIPPAPGNTANYTPEAGQTWATHVPAGRAAPNPGKLSLSQKPKGNPAAQL